MRILGRMRRHRPVTPVIAREGGGLIVLRAADVEALMGDSRIRQTEIELPRQREWRTGRCSIFSASAW